MTRKRKVTKAYKLSVVIVPVERKKTKPSNTKPTKLKIVIPSQDNEIII
jgi:hypothetical protein